MTRYPDDYWSQLRYGYSELLAEFGAAKLDEFIDRFCWTEQRSFSRNARPIKVVTGIKDRNGLSQLLFQTGAIRRTLSEVATMLPPMTERTLTCTSVALRKHSKEIPPQQEIFEGVKQNDPKMMRYWRELGELKLPFVVEHVEDLVLNGPVLVGVWFRENIGLLQDELEQDGFKVAVVHGGTGASARERIGREFNDGDVNVLIGQIGAMNTSWNLQQASSNVVIMDDHFSPGIIQQFYSRVYRTGQTRHTQVDFIKAENHKLDDAIAAVRMKKMKIDDALLSQLEREVQ